MYHQVGPFSRPAAHRAVYCHVDRFRRQMAWLRFARHNVISLEHAYRCLFEGAPIPPRAVVLTFDDGCDNFREHAWPVLRRHGYPATMFLVANLLGKTTREWMTDMPPSPLMDAAAIRELRREGMRFGSHTLHHVRLSQCAPAQMRREIFESKDALESLLGEPVPDFCYPYGDYDERARALVAEAGYRTGLTCVRAAANHAANALEIPRKAISYGDNVAGFWWKLHMKNSPKKQR